MASCRIAMNFSVAGSLSDLQYKTINTVNEPFYYLSDGNICLRALHDGVHATAHHSPEAT